VLDKLAAVSRLTSRMALYLSYAGLIGMTAIISWQVFARYILNAAPSWTEQAALLLMLWFILFAAAAGVREGFHIRLVMLEETLSPGRKRALRLFSHGVVMAFGTAMAWSGGELAVATFRHTIPTLGVTRALAYLPIASAGALIVIYALEHIIREWRGADVEKTWS